MKGDGDFNVMEEMSIEEMDARVEEMKQKILYSINNGIKMLGMEKDDTFYKRLKENIPLTSCDFNGNAIFYI